MNLIIPEKREGGKFCKLHNVADVFTGNQGQLFNETTVLKSAAVKAFSD